MTPSVALRRFRLVRSAWAWSVRLLRWLVCPMAFRPPTFPLVVDIYRLNGAGGTYGAPDVRVNGNLSLGRRVTTVQDFAATGAPFPILAEILLPKLTDVRATWNGVVGDAVEVPSGSKRFYFVRWVDDIGKGFSNEYRIAFATYDIQGNVALLGINSAPVPLL